MEFVIIFLAGLVLGFIGAYIHARFHYAGEMVVEEDQDGWGKVRLVVSRDDIFDQDWVYFRRRNKSESLDGHKSN